MASLNAEMAMARDRAKLRETELEVSHQVAFAFRDMEPTSALSRDQLQSPAGGPAQRGCREDLD